LRPLILAALLAVSAWLPSCGASPESDSGPVVVATVGPRVVDWPGVEAAFRARSDAFELPRTGVGFEAYRDRLLRDLFVEEVLLLEAEQRGLSEGDVAESAAAALEALGEDGAEHVIERYGSAAAHRERLHRRLLVEAAERAVRRELEAALVIPDEQVESSRERFAHLLRRPGRIQARQIFLDDPETARIAHLRLSEGADFVALARELTGEDGELGWMSVDEAPPLLVRGTADLEPGGFSPILNSPLGYHIVQLRARAPEGRIEGEAAQVIVRRALRAEASDSKLRAWLAARLDEIGLTVHEDAAARVRCCREGRPYLGPPGGSS
jgi:parvulin-like peptidyl-prolyl isomerase